MAGIIRAIRSQAVADFPDFTDTALQQSAFSIIEKCIQLNRTKCLLYFMSRGVAIDTLPRYSRIPPLSHLFLVHGRKTQLRQAITMLSIVALLEELLILNISLSTIKYRVLRWGDPLPAPSHIPYSFLSTETATAAPPPSLPPSLPPCPTSRSGRHFFHPLTDRDFASISSSSSTRVCYLLAHTASSYCRYLIHAARVLAERRHAAASIHTADACASNTVPIAVAVHSAAPITFNATSAGGVPLLSWAASQRRGGRVIEMVAWARELQEAAGEALAHEDALFVRRDCGNESVGTGTGAGTGTGIGKGVDADACSSDTVWEVWQREFLTHSSPILRAGMGARGSYCRHCHALFLRPAHPGTFLRVPPLAEMAVAEHVGRIPLENARTAGAVRALAGLSGPEEMSARTEGVHAGASTGARGGAGQSGDTGVNVGIGTDVSMRAKAGVIAHNAERPSLAAITAEHDGVETTSFAASYLQRSLPPLPATSLLYPSLKTMHNKLLAFCHSCGPETLATALDVLLTGELCTYARGLALVHVRAIQRSLLGVEGQPDAAKFEDAAATYLSEYARRGVDARQLWDAMYRSHRCVRAPSQGDLFLLLLSLAIAAVLRARTRPAVHWGRMDVGCIGAVHMGISIQPLPLFTGMDYEQHTRYARDSESSVRLSSSLAESACVSGSTSPLPYVDESVEESTLKADTTPSTSTGVKGTFIPVFAPIVSSASGSTSTSLPLVEVRVGVSRGKWDRGLWRGAHHRRRSRNNVSAKTSTSVGDAKSARADVAVAESVSMIAAPAGHCMEDADHTAANIATQQGLRSEEGLQSTQTCTGVGFWSYWEPLVGVLPAHVRAPPPNRCSLSRSNASCRRTATTVTGGEVAVAARSRERGPSEHCIILPSSVLPLMNQHLLTPLALSNPNTLVTRNTAETLATPNMPNTLGILTSLPSPFLASPGALLAAADEPIGTHPCLGHWSYHALKSRVRDTLEMPMPTPVDAAHGEGASAEAQHLSSSTTGGATVSKPAPTAITLQQSHNPPSSLSCPFPPNFSPLRGPATPAPAHVADLYAPVPSCALCALPAPVARRVVAAVTNCNLRHEGDSDALTHAVYTCGATASVASETGVVATAEKKAVTPRYVPSSIGRLASYGRKITLLRMLLAHGAETPLFTHVDAAAVHMRWTHWFCARYGKLLERAGVWLTGASQFLPPPSEDALKEGKWPVYPMCSSVCLPESALNSALRANRTRAAALAYMHASMTYGRGRACRDCTPTARATTAAGVAAGPGLFTEEAGEGLTREAVNTWGFSDYADRDAGAGEAYISGFFRENAKGLADMGTQTLPNWLWGLVCRHRYPYCMAWILSQVNKYDGRAPRPQRLAALNTALVVAAPHQRYRGRSPRRVHVGVASPPGDAVMARMGRNTCSHAGVLSHHGVYARLPCHFDFPFPVALPRWETTFRSTISAVVGPLEQNGDDSSWIDDMGGHQSGTTMPPVGVESGVGGGACFSAGEVVARVMCRSTPFHEPSPQPPPYMQHPDPMRTLKLSVLAMQCMAQRPCGPGAVVPEGTTVWRDDDALRWAVEACVCAIRDLNVAASERAECLKTLVDAALQRMGLEGTEWQTRIIPPHTHIPQTPTPTCAHISALTETSTGALWTVEVEIRVSESDVDLLHIAAVANTNAILAVLEAKAAGERAVRAYVEDVVRGLMRQLWNK